MPHVAAEDGVRLYYETGGEGRPVLLLTGAFSTLEDWHESGIFEELARGRRVIAMDLRGHGRSDAPHDAGAYGWPKNARDAVAVLAAAGAEDADVYGFSMGGQVVVAMLHGDTSRIRSLAGMGVYVPQADFVAPAAQLVERAQIVRERGLTPASLEAVTLGVGLGPSAGWVDRATRGDAAAYAAEAEGQAAIEDQRPPVAGPPTLLISAERDAFSVALCQDLPSQFSYIRYEQLDGLDHFHGLDRGILAPLRKFWSSLG